MRVTHVITGLKQGGAQEMLFKLISCRQLQGIDHHVVSLTNGGPIAEKIRASGGDVVTLGLNRHSGIRRGLSCLVSALLDSRPDVVQTWMYHADLLGGAAAKRLQRSVPVVWNIRHSNLERGVDPWTTRLTSRLCAWTSRLIPEMIVVNSETGRRFHVNLGYACDRMRMIPNGFDTVEFCPADVLGRGVRQELGVSMVAPVVGCVARYHAQKDYPTLIAAAEQIMAALPETHFVFCGTNVCESNTELMEAIRSTRREKQFHLLGERDDIPAIQAGLDLAVLSAAAGEGFPNVIGEAMACGVPCVATDVGDSAAVIGETGLVVPPRQPSELADACLKILQMTPSARRELGLRARDRICNEFSIERISEEYSDLWRSLIRKRNGELHSSRKVA